MCFRLQGRERVNSDEALTTALTQHTASTVIEADSVFVPVVFTATCATRNSGLHDTNSKTEEEVLQITTSTMSLSTCTGGLTTGTRCEIDELIATAIDGSHDQGGGCHIFRVGRPHDDAMDRPTVALRILHICHHTPRLTRTHNNSTRPHSYPTAQSWHFDGSSLWMSHHPSGSWQGDPWYSV